MARSRSETERLDRLASEVRRGGGLPLPLLFEAILNELLDNGIADDARLLAIVTDKARFKSNKVAETWGGTERDQWEFLTDDLLTQLAHLEYIARNGDDRWHIGEGFVAGADLPVIPARKGLNAAGGVTAWSKEERGAVNDVDRYEVDADHIDRQPRGHRHDDQFMNLLRSSSAALGPIHEVLVDSNGVVIDGRHRLEIDPSWPKKVIRRLDGGEITTREERIAMIAHLDDINGRVALTAAERKKVNQVLGALPGVNEIKRKRIEAELRRDPARSNLAISDLVGVDDMTVNKVRQELENSEIRDSRIHCYGGAKGTGKPKHLADCWCGEGDYTPPTPKEPKPPKPKTDSERIDDWLMELVASGYVHVKNPERRKELVARLLADTGIDRSHGALEQRLDRLTPITPTRPVPTPTPTPTPIPTPVVVIEPGSVDEPTESDPEVRHCPPLQCPCCKEVVHGG